MYDHLSATTADPPPSRTRLLILLALGVGLSLLLAGFSMAAAQSLLPPDISAFTPTAEDGYRADGEVVTLADEDLPMIARLDPALRDALRQAEAAAVADGVAFQVTSGWRSERYQARLLEDAIEEHGSEQVAREFVATPDLSKHVTGEAVDIAPIDAQDWLIRHGAAYGICQTYANERWHFELATDPGGVCPEMRQDAAG
ncbi:M15 family metallopeptidase [Microbacterium ureisolvens]|uniref:M15 family metallopeptidase n=1 Tax=Microbacterium ureisolvens TaxID=2781186 RepID=UPI00362A6EF5